MDVRYLVSHPSVEENFGRTTITRGPLVYCLEHVDNPEVKLSEIVINPAHQPKVEYKPSLLGEIVQLYLVAEKRKIDPNWKAELYQPIRSIEHISNSNKIEVVSIPYYVWENRTPGAMKIWNLYSKTQLPVFIQLQEWMSMEKIVFYYPDGHESHFEYGHPERPERVEAIRNALQVASLWDPYPKLKPIDLPSEILEVIHSQAYLSLLEMTCRRSGHLDTDTYTTASSWELAHRAAGGAAAVASYIWEGKARRAFALTRPPGHHATHGQGMGFCLLNNIAIAAEYLIRIYHTQKLAIIDLDLHHGNGTQDIFWRRNDVLYISTHQSPFYPGTGQLEQFGEGDGEGWTVNFPLPAGSGDIAFNTYMEELILPLLDQRNPQMILVSYGFDTHWLDPLGQLLISANCYGNLIQKLCTWADTHCEGKIGLILEGGYDLNAGRTCSLAVTSAMLGISWEDPLPCPYLEGNSWQQAIKRAKSMWNL